LQGITVPRVKAGIRGTPFSAEGPLLITHWGMSGPAILKLSAFAARKLALKNWNFTASINWLPEYNEQSLKEKLQELRFALAAKIMDGNCPLGLPLRLWNHLLREAGIPEHTRWSDMTAKAQNKLSKSCCNQEYEVKGKTTFKEEFVTAGGVSLDEVDSDTMESRLAPGIYFAGEVLDADGITGGYNFQQAWTTGFIAAKAIAAAGIL
jgi:predicted Rossmann fold flavoprotein